MAPTLYVIICIPLSVLLLLCFHCYHEMCMCLCIGNTKSVSSCCLWCVKIHNETEGIAEQIHTEMQTRIHIHTHVCAPSANFTVELFNILAALNQKEVSTDFQNNKEWHCMMEVQYFNRALTFNSSSLLSISHN